MDVIISGFCGTRTRRGTEAKQWKSRTVLRKEKIDEQETRRNLKCNDRLVQVPWRLIIKDEVNLVEGAVAVFEASCTASLKTPFYEMSQIEHASFYGGASLLD